MTIEEEYNSFVEEQYAGKSLEERQKLGQFYTLIFNNLLILYEL